MKNLRLQLLFSHLLLVLMMLIVMVGGIACVFHLGHSIDRILKDNYKSVIAAQNMKEALERQDSAATFYMAGQVKRAHDQYERSAEQFEAAFTVEAHNVTEKGEQDAINDIDGIYHRHYRPSMRQLLYASVPAEREKAYYFSTVEPLFERMKTRAQDILEMNQRAIEKRDRAAKAEARTTALVGIAVAVIGFVLAVAFALRMIRVAMAPVLTLARQAEEIGAGHLNQRIDLCRSDEIGALADAFNRMIEKLRQARSLAEERLHRAERMSDAAVDSMYDPIIITDASGLVVHLNRAAEGLFGEANKAVGTKVDRVVKERRIATAFAQAIHEDQVSADEGEGAFVPFEVGGTQRIYRLRATPMRDEQNTLLGAVAVLEDVTHLRELDRLKTEFISVASHELRTPVTSLLLAAQLLQEGAAGPLTDDQRMVVNAQREDLDRLERLMRDILDITRLEAGVAPPRFEMVAPDELVRAAVNAVAQQAEAKGLTLSSALPTHLPKIRADRAQLTRVLINLLNNAIRHTPEDGQVSISVEISGGAVRLMVRDTGAGIPAEYQSRIFERFVQVPGATRGGAGLGLSIAKTIVQAHAGTISVSSVLHQGSEFTVTIPLNNDAING